MKNSKKTRKNNYDRSNYWDSLFILSYIYFFIVYE